MISYHIYCWLFHHHSRSIGNARADFRLAPRDTSNFFIIISLPLMEVCLTKASSPISGRHGHLLPTDIADIALRHQPAASFLSHLLLRTGLSHKSPSLSS